MARNIFKGLGVALITPFTSDGNVDYKLLDTEIAYIYVVGDNVLTTDNLNNELGINNVNDINFPFHTSLDTYRKL